MIINFKFTATNGRVYEGMRTEFDRNYPHEGTAMFFVEDEDNTETGGYFEVNMIKDEPEGGKLTGEGYVCEYPQSDMANPANILQGDKVEIELIEHDFDEVLEKANAKLLDKGLMIVADYDPETDVWGVAMQIKRTGKLNYFAVDVETDDMAQIVDSCYLHAIIYAEEQEKKTDITIEQAEERLMRIAKNDEDYWADEVYGMVHNAFMQLVQQTEDKHKVIDANGNIVNSADSSGDDSEWYDNIREDFMQTAFETIKNFLNK